MRIPLRDLTDLSARDLVGKSTYNVRRLLGTLPEHGAGRRLRSQWDERVVPEGGPDVVLLTPRDWAIHVQWESVIGHALRLRGASVRVLGCGGGLEVCDEKNCHRAPPMPCRSCTRYTRDAAAAHGFDRTELDYGPEAGWPELDELGVDELYQVEWHGVALGQLAVIPSQWFAMTTRVHEDPEAPETIRAFLRSGRRVVEALERWFDERRPDVVVMLNGLFFFESLCWAMCRDRGIDVVTYERGFVKDTLIFRRNGCACHFDHEPWWGEWSKRQLSPAEDERLDAFCEARRTGGETIDAYWKTARFAEVDRSDRGRLAVMFTNLTWDSAVIGKELVFDSIHDWVDAAITAFADRPDDELLIRVHPAELKLRGKQTREPIAEVVQRRWPVLPPNVRLLGPEDATSSYTLMEQADIGLVYTSTTGIELALLDTPVLVAGNPHYRGKGFTVDPVDPGSWRAQLEAMLDDPHALRPDRDLARRYAWLFFFAGPIRFPFVDEPRVGQAQVVTRRLEDLAPGRHADLDRLCDGILGVGDFGPPTSGVDVGSR